MKKFFIICASAFAGAMDIGLGALCGVLLAQYVGIADTYALVGVLIAGSFLAVLPDLDILLDSVLGTRISFDHHQTIMHRPIVIIPVSVAVCGALGAVWGEPLLGAVLALVCVTYHYLHDTHFGIAWFWPFLTVYVRFTGVRDPGDIDPEHEHSRFLRRFLSPTKLSLIELTIAGTSMGYAINLATGSGVGTILACLGTLFVLVVWVMYALTRRA